MSAADDAYAAAKVEIKKAQDGASRILSLASSEFASLIRLPDEISQLVELQSLNLLSPRITDLTPLVALKGLQRLSLNNCAVTDLNPLSCLKDLRFLSLVNTEVADLAPLSGLTLLQRLELNNTNVTDLSSLSELKELSNLWLNGSQVLDLRPRLPLASLLPFKTFHTGLHFPDTPAAPATPELARLSRIEPPRFYRRVFGSIVRLLFRQRSSLRRMPPLLLVA